MVMPMRPEGTDDWTEDQLTEIITRDCLIGVALPRVGVTTNIIVDTRPAMHPSGELTIGDELSDVVALQEIVTRNQVWPRMAAKYGVENPVPPWKTSLDGLCDALDHAACDTHASHFQGSPRRRGRLSATVYPDLPYPESQLVSLAHSLLSRGIITEDELIDGCR